MKVVFFGSGAFGVPTLRSLAAERTVALVVSQPDRPAGRGRRSTATPIATFAADAGLPVLRTDDANQDEVASTVHELDADAYVVIAFGQKLLPGLLGETFAINLHASLLPLYRGAAPINWCMIDGHAESGVSVITLAQRMDAGRVLASASLAIDPLETAGELHDRLAELGPAVVADVLAARAADRLEGAEQDDTLASRAPKLRRADAYLDFRGSAEQVRCRIHGLTPWPGVSVRLGDREVRLWRVRDERFAPEGEDAAPGSLVEGDAVRCGKGLVRLLEVQPAGGRRMSMEEFRRGHAVPDGTVVESTVPPPVETSS